MDKNDSKFFEAQTEKLGQLLQSTRELSASALEILMGLAVFWKNQQKWPRG
jgi:hypothetical protein